MNLALVALVVREYDEAIEFFTSRLGFDLIEDTEVSDLKRWVVVGKQNGCNLLLARAANEDQARCIGHQTGGRVFLFLHTDDFWKDYNELKSKGISFVREPAKETWGTVAVFEDLYGNLWDLIQPNPVSKSDS